MSYQALNTAITGLRAAQQQLSVISNNVSNATSPGYNRQILPQSAQVLGSTGDTIGVRTSTVIRSVDMNLQRDLWTQVSATNALDIQVQYLQKIQDFHGPPASEFSIAAELSDLKDAFAALSDAPDDLIPLQSTLNQARVVADKFNDYGDYINTLRNDTQNDILSSIDKINGLLQEITSINIQVRGSENANRSKAGLQDQRDIAIKELTEEMDITFFERADGVLVVQTSDGLQLADDQTYKLEYNNAPLSAQQYYPESINGIFVTCLDGHNRQVASIDITEREIGGRLGGLVKLRDETLPQYQAQADELAYQVASRFEDQGLKLFTDKDGNVPIGDAPDPFNLDAFGQPDPIAVDYVGFANIMQVNTKIVDDVSLLQRGTYVSDEAIPTGDGELIRRVLEHTFGAIDYQQIEGTINLDDPAGDPLVTQLGLTPTNNIIGGVDLGNFAQIDFGMLSNFITIGNIFGSPANPVVPVTNDQFQITFSDVSRNLGPTTITVELSIAAAQAAPNALGQVVQEINDQLAVSGIDPLLSASASIGINGQLQIESSGEFSITTTGIPNALGDAAAASLGIKGDPSFPESLLNLFPNYPADDEFEIAFGTDILTIDLSSISTNFSLGAPALVSDATGAAFVAGAPIDDAVDQLMSEVNRQLNALGILPSEAQATQNTYGQIVLSTQRDVSITATTIGTDALNSLGFQEGVFAAENPNFTIQVGTSEPVTVFLEPTDTINDLVAKLEWNATTQTGIPGLFVEINADGGLTLRPGIDDQNGGTVYGGDITINSSAFNADPAIATNPAINALPSVVNVVSALFGSFTVNGATVNNNSPITDFTYESEITAGSDTFTNFRNSYLGPGADISTDIYSAFDLVDYAQKLVNSTSSDLAIVQSSFENEDTLREIIQRDFSDLSGVNIDEEMSNLIIVQTAYAAAARTITAVDEMFQELINSIRR